MKPSSYPRGADTPLPKAKDTCVWVQGVVKPEQITQVIICQQNEVSQAKEVVHTV
jgi:hypothetical protein